MTATAKRTRKCQFRDKEWQKFSEQAVEDSLSFTAQSMKQVEREAKALFAKQVKEAIRHLAPDETFIMLTRFVVIDAKGHTRVPTKDREHTPQSIAWRKAVLWRDGYACVECGSKFKLVAHHIKPWAKHPEARFDLDNGQTLCEGCHAEKHPHLKRLAKAGV